MVVLAHPTGNVFVREAVSALDRAGLLAEFHTSIAACGRNVFAKFSRIPGLGEIRRRELPAEFQKKLHLHPFRECGRLLSSRIGFDFAIKHESGFFCLDAVYRSFDQSVARGISAGKISSVYCYEDSAFDTFRVAKTNGITCIYDLPIAHWSTVQRLLQEEADRLPEWICTMDGLKDSWKKLARKNSELEMADLVICPSQFVRDSIPSEVLNQKRIKVIKFGSPVFPKSVRRSRSGPLKVLFAGSMTQRKGLSDVFKAFRNLDAQRFALHIIGTPLASMDFYRRQFSNFIYHTTRANSAVLELMCSCDVLVLPSIVEGRALVQQEAMACGLPVVATRNAGAEDLLEDGTAGFLVPIRSPESIAAKLELLESNRDLLESMSHAARLKAELLQWDRYRTQIVEAVASLNGLST